MTRDEREAVGSAAVSRAGGTATIQTEPASERPQALMAFDSTAPVGDRLADDRLGAWRVFLEAHARVSRRLDDELRAAHGISLAEYDALVQLVESPHQRLRMNQLADRVLLSRSG